MNSLKSQIFPKSEHKKLQIKEQIYFDKLASLGVRANGCFQKFPTFAEIRDRNLENPQQKFNLRRRFHFMGKQHQVSSKGRNSQIRIRSNKIQNSDK